MADDTGKPQGPLLSPAGSQNALQDEETHLNEFTVFQDVSEHRLDGKSYDVDDIAGGDEEAIAASPLMALKNTEQSGSPYAESSDQPHQADLSGDEILTVETPTRSLNDMDTSPEAGARIITQSLSEAVEPDQISDVAFESYDAPPEALGALSTNQSGALSSELDDTFQESDLNQTDVPPPNDIPPASDDINTPPPEPEPPTPPEEPEEDNQGPGNNKGHGNNTDGVDDDNPGQGQGGPNADKEGDGIDEDEGQPGNQGDDTPGAGQNPPDDEQDPPTDEPSDSDTDTDGGGPPSDNNGKGPGNNKGHGNNTDGVDDDNPGQGQGGPNADKEGDGIDEDEGLRGNQGDDTPGASQNIAQNIEDTDVNAFDTLSENEADYFEFQTFSEDVASESWLSVIDDSSQSTANGGFQVATSSEGVSWLDTMSGYDDTEDQPFDEAADISKTQVTLDIGDMSGDTIDHTDFGGGTF